MNNVVDLLPFWFTLSIIIFVYTYVILLPSTSILNLLDLIFS